MALESCKGIYDTLCPISEFIEKEKINSSDTCLCMKVDQCEEMRQDGNMKDSYVYIAIWSIAILSVPFLISCSYQ